MAIIKNKLLFFTTSPRTPSKMVPEIKLLYEKFAGYPWNKSVQEEFINELAISEFFEGTGSPSDKAFSARDRINRAPKSLGFIDLKPYIELTDAGKSFIYGKRRTEIFLRQLLKFQLPSPYHVEAQSIIGTFNIKPYLEILRLIKSLEYITFDEFKIYAVQMTDYHQFEDTADAILQFRKEKSQNKGRYKQFVDTTWTNEIFKIFKDDILAGKTKTRETNDYSLKNFIRTKKRNIRDYTDACFRYLRYTGLVSISYKGRSLSIFADKMDEVDFILSTVNRNPVYIDNEVEYKKYLFSANYPKLYTDNRDNLVDIIMRTGPFTKKDLSKKTIEELKDLRDSIVKQHKDAIINEQITKIKSYALYSEIIDTFNEIITNEYYDAPLMFEYNTWRAMTMLDGGNIKGNLIFDDTGQPLSTAPGNMADIECYYEDFSLSVEVTLQSGQKQYEAEGESVARHYGKLKRETGKDTYCLFIAPRINAATLAYFYGLNKIPINLYGGKSKIVPLELDQFMMLIENSYNYEAQPNSNDIRRFLDYIIELCEHTTDENDWNNNIQKCVSTWPV